MPACRRCYNEQEPLEKGGLCSACLADEHADLDEAAQATPLGALAHVLFVATEHYGLQTALYQITENPEGAAVELERMVKSAERRRTRAEMNFRAVTRWPTEKPLPGWPEYLLEHHRTA